MSFLLIPYTQSPSKTCPIIIPKEKGRMKNSWMNAETPEDDTGINGLMDR